MRIRSPPLLVHAQKGPAFADYIAVSAATTLQPSSKLRAQHVVIGPPIIGTTAGHGISQTHPDPLVA